MPAKTAGRGHVRKGAKKEIIGAKEMVGPTGDVPVANSMLTACVMPQAFWAVIWTMLREAFVLRCSRGAARVSMRGKKATFQNAFAESRYAFFVGRLDVFLGSRTPG